METEKNKVKTEFDQLAGLKARKDTLQLNFIDEMQGKPNASGYRGYGVISKKIEKDLVKLDSMIKVLELRKDTTLRATVNKMTANQEANNKYGFLGSFRALYRLQHKSEDNSVWMISMGIKLLLLMIELMSILLQKRSWAEEPTMRSTNWKNRNSFSDPIAKGKISLHKKRGPSNSRRALFLLEYFWTKIWSETSSSFSSCPLISS